MTLAVAHDEGRANSHQRASPARCGGRRRSREIKAGDGGGVGKGGATTLTANGRTIGEGRVDKTTPFRYSLYEGQDVGEDSGSPGDFSYKPPFKFDGKLGRVTVELK